MYIQSNCKEVIIKSLITCLLLSVVFTDELVTLFLINPGSYSNGRAHTMIANKSTSSMSFYNPAALSFIKTNQISISYANIFPNLAADVYHIFNSFNYQLNETFSIGGNLIYSDLGKAIQSNHINWSSVSNLNSNYIGKSIDLASSALAITIGLGYKITNYSSIGLNSKTYKLNQFYNPEKIYTYYSENSEKFIDTTRFISGVGQAFDVSYFSKIKRFNFGINVSNISLEKTAPTNLSTGIEMKLFNHGENSLIGALQIDKVLKNESNIIQRFAMQYEYSDKMIVQIGRMISNELVKLNSDGEEENMNYYTWGLGVKIWKLLFHLSYTGGKIAHPITNTMYLTTSYNLN